ncbi:uncharacterized protein LOC116015959 [Ipomoea triloba]|uniref:uncharacterized protein LOC116015959 n=1 Tax=Ipomoea triloba TaxID=35885 RepID=UPI00125CEFFE|nr:uncharacterized protein LOC116015959 [Ipomoea triloba]
MLSSLIEENICLAVAVLYYTWRARNKAVWEAFLPTPRRVVESAAATLHVWSVASPSPQPHGQSTPSASAASHGQSAENHIPNQQRPKCYFDGSFSPATLRRTFGAVLVVSDSIFMAACAGPLPDCFLPLMAEVLACKEVLS